LFSNTIKYLVLILVLLLPSQAWAACVADGANWATTPDYVSVASCVSQADAGETVAVSTGTVTWDHQLLITKGINLIGTGNPTITSAVAADNLILYEPADYTLNTPLRISGFTFDLNSVGHGIYLKNSPTDTTIQTKIRIDNNSIINGGASYQALRSGGMRGVVDNNTFTGSNHPFRFSYGAGELWWTNWNGMVFGENDGALYFENNTIESVGWVSDCEQGNRQVWRYNNITSSSINGGTLIDGHGNQYSTIWACFGNEVYGNLIDLNGSYGKIVSIRGGKGLAFYNALVDFDTENSNRSAYVYEEEWDYYNQTTNNCGTTPETSSCSKDGQPQHPNDTYVWTNRKSYNGALLTVFLGSNDCDNSVSTNTDPCTDLAHGYSINENDEWHQDATSFDGTSGIGCGSALPTPWSCTPGVAFWVTDQSCADITAFVGSSATIINGILYKCTSANTWTSYYTPYSYPHLLRGGTSYAVTVSNAGPGVAGANITSSTSTINYTGTSGTNTENVSSGNNLILTATCPATAPRISWGGDCSGTTATCTLSNITAAKTVSLTCGQHSAWQ
jgi:hypothetical protein